MCGHNFKNLYFYVTLIEFVVTPRSSLIKEKNMIKYWHNWVANQLTFSPFDRNGFLLLFYKTIYFSADLPPNYASNLSCFFCFYQLLLGVTMISMVTCRVGLMCQMALLFVGAGLAMKLILKPKRTKFLFLYFLIGIK